MKRIGFIVKPDQANTAELQRELVSWLRADGHDVLVLGPIGPEFERSEPEPAAPDDAPLDFAVVLGGDGTMLHASQLVADRGVPILGINLGRLGFLTQFDPHGAKDAISAAIAGELAISKRMRLSVCFRPAGGEPIVRSALNDAVLHQGAMARLITLEAKMNNIPIAGYRADGLIVSTPTGSTAYNLAAGGPIITPDQSSMALTPICAHGLTNRPLVVDKDATITLELGESSQDVVLTVDGQWARGVRYGDRVDITAADKPLLLFNSGKPYFDILRDKLHWDARTLSKKS